MGNTREGEPAARAARAASRRLTKPETFTLTQQRYVETIHALSGAEGVRTTDLAARLGVSLPSASQAVSRLAGMGLVVRKSRYEIRLSPRGRTIAGKLERRHQALREFMIDVLGMDEEAADRNACRMEHWAGPQLIERCIAFSGYARRDPKSRQWLKGFRGPCSSTT
ncbi:MAG: metal-dependent transcriptional regulator [Kiritimatiellae bacterium]|nr:metal-dependent transcriptional regulator [Kiritimatiellia bacterium]